jgi:20S proteasome alpha/beta subunit
MSALDIRRRGVPRRPRWLKHGRYAGIKAMTLCIAVKCQDAGVPNVVCCFDSQVGNDYESSESVFKWDILGPGIAVMFAGLLDDSKDLIAAYRQHLFKTPITSHNIKTELWAPMKNFLDKSECESEFMEPGGKPELLVAAFVNQKPRLLTISEHGISSNSFYGCIGTGADSATAMLRWRKPDLDCPLDRAIYYAYEAKSFGEVSPHVGKQTYMLVLKPHDDLDLKVATVEDEGLGVLQKLFDDIGPRPIHSHWIFPREHLL